METVRCLAEYIIHTSGVYVDTLQAQAGCDSVIELVLNIRSLN